MDWLSGYSFAAWRREPDLAQSSQMRISFNFLARQISCSLSDRKIERGDGLAAAARRQVEATASRTVAQFASKAAVIAHWRAIAARRRPANSCQCGSRAEIATALDPICGAVAELPTNARRRSIARQCHRHELRGHATSRRRPVRYHQRPRGTRTSGHGGVITGACRVFRRRPLTANRVAHGRTWLAGAATGRQYGKGSYAHNSRLLS